MDSKDFIAANGAILRKVGTMRQVARIRRAVLDDGRERGLRVAEFSNGGGLSFTVLLDRGMDIGDAAFGGASLGWLGPCGFQHPSYHDPEGLGWLRSWGGGLLTGCGLRSAGAPGVVDGESFGLHGRLSNTPAEDVKCHEEWIGDRYLMSVTGSMREVRHFGENLLLTRTVATEFGTNVIKVSDKVQNCGFRPSQAMLLYHINLGWPLLDECSFVETVSHAVEPRDDEAAKGLLSWSKCQEPAPGYKEQCFYHDLPAGPDGFATVSLVNPSLALKFSVSYRKAELPFLTQWKNLGEGEYVMGLEPANCHVEGLAAEREKFKSLRILQPGESFETLLALSVSRTK